MDGLSAKVFRTYNASSTLQKELHFSSDPNNSILQKKNDYDTANRKVALFCNHKKIQ